MPKEFDNCIKKGGRVRTKSLKGGKFMRICFLKGKSFAGEVKTAKKMSSKSRKAVEKLSKVLNRG